jgi:hypothetical protein
VRGICKDKDNENMFLEVSVDILAVRYETYTWTDLRDGREVYVC